tara:strand:+ start:1873 stop:3135 length:1263 start_codon:yes stop_codon:yes gene_type:complete
MAISKDQIQQIIGEGLTELAQQGVLDLGEVSAIVNAISNPLVETFEAQAGLSGLPVRTFTEFNPLSDIVSNVKHKVSKPLWTKIGTSGNAATLTNFYMNTNSAVGLTTSSTFPYYLNIYDEDPASVHSGSADPNFAIAYGHKTGGGAYNHNSNASYGLQYPTRAIYAQYKALLLDPADKKFSFGGVDSDDIWVVNINRARIKEKLDPGNWEIRLKETGHGAGAKTLRLIDDSLQGMNPYGSVDAPVQGGRVYNIMSGTIELPDDDPKFAVPTGSTKYGLVYPDLGIIVLHPAAISGAINLTPTTTSGSGQINTPNDNLLSFRTSLDSGSFFRARSEEEVTSTHYFCRIQNKDYNFSNNPTFFTASDGSFTNASFYKDPKVYITTVGLYNENNELLAVAKLSKPLLKSFSKEAVIKVKLDF